LEVLLGQPFLKFTFSYGDELCIHFGQPRSYVLPRFGQKTEGSYIIGTRASNWQFLSSVRKTVICGIDGPDPDMPLPPRPQALLPLEYGPVSKKDMLELDFVQRGAKVASVDVFKTEPKGVPGYGFSLAFSDHSFFWLFPNPTEEDDELDVELADWEVFMPGMHLGVGPGEKWSCTPSRKSSGPRRSKGKS
jgi:hypothetical protein